MQIQIAIASHFRSLQIEKKTLALLKKHNFNFKYVHVFVSFESIESYIPIANKLGFNLIISGSTILETRNHIIQHFSDGTHIVEMDDDIEDIKTTLKNTKEKSVGNLQCLFEESFELLIDKGGGLWGFNANTNNYFASGKDQWGLRSIINSCLGYVNDRSIVLTVMEKEDFERCILFYLNGKSILKRGGYGIKTKYWTNPGGIQQHYNKEKRIQVQADSAHIISFKYPKLVREQRRKCGLIDIRFKGKDPLNIYEKQN